MEQVQISQCLVHSHVHKPALDFSHLHEQIHDLLGSGSVDEAVDIRHTSVKRMCFPEILSGGVLKRSAGHLADRKAKFPGDGKTELREIADHDFCHPEILERNRRCDTDRFLLPDALDASSR